MPVEQSAAAPLTVSAPAPVVVVPASVGAATSARRSRGLADIAPKYVAKSGLCQASDMESPRGTSVRIQHLTAAAAAAAAAAQPPEGRSRFPKLDECAHFHYDLVELGPFQVCLYEEELKPLASEDSENKYYHVSVTSLGKTWVLRRSYDNFRMLDSQLHRCIYDRKFSGLPELPPEENVPGTNHEESVRHLLTDYLTRFSQIAGNLINCGPVLNWLELDNRGRRLLVPDGDNCPINTPAVAAAYAVKRYTAQAGDEISFEVGDMISVIDMPPPEESVWWRGKRGFQVGFFPCECVAVIGDKVPRNLQLPTPPPPPPGDQPSKPVLRKHGKLIAFFRSFILSRPSRRRLKQSGILKERVFGCDLGEHLLNSGHEIPMVLKCCAEFIETNGIVDGIYRLSGVNSNIQKLRNAFDEDRVPALYEDEAILQDIHSVASLLKMYFRELPNPLCTYQLYHTFVNAVQSSQEEGYRLLRMRDAVQKLPPPHYRTLEYLMRHLARVAEHGHATGMTPRNVAIVWAPNLLRCKELEVGGVAALQGVGVQAVVTEFLVCYTDLIFSDGLPPITLPPQDVTPKRSRPKSLAISTPTKLLSLEEARSRALSAGKSEQEYIEVGGGPSNLPAKYHTVIELPGSGRKRSGSKRSPLGWKSFFSKSGRKSNSSAPQRKASTPSDLGLHQEKAVTEADLVQGRRRLRPVKSAESLASGANSSRNSAAIEQAELTTPEDLSSPLHGSAAAKATGHNRSVSHDSYFDNLAETPVHTRPTTSLTTHHFYRPSRLPEEENEENFSSSLDLSEIHLNFDLEESEMRIFSEDETLVSTSMGSGSFVSQGSPRVGAFRRAQQNATKRLPLRELPPPRARPEDSNSACISTDPSPKKQKTCGSPGSSRSKRSRLEEQLGPAAEFRYIDSQSPENQQMLVQADVHEQFAPDRKFSAATPPSLSSCTNHMTSPSLAEATVSDNESFTVHSSGLTTPDTPLLVYTPLRDDTNSSTTTPDYENLNINKMTSSPAALPGSRYERLVTPSPSPTGLTPRIEIPPECSPLTQDSGYGDVRYENLPLSRQPLGTGLQHGEATYVNMALAKSESSSPPVQSPVECRITIVYENIRSPKKPTPPATYECMASHQPSERPSSEQEVSQEEYETVTTPTDTAAKESLCSNIYQNIPHALDHQQEEEHLYEDIQVALSSQEELSSPITDEENTCTSTNNVTSDPDQQVYQQVKNFRRSVHEVNQLLDPVSAENEEMKDNVDNYVVNNTVGPVESLCDVSENVQKSLEVESTGNGSVVTEKPVVLVETKIVPDKEEKEVMPVSNMDVEFSQPDLQQEPTVGEPPPGNEILAQQDVHKENILPMLHNNVDETTNVLKDSEVQENHCDIETISIPFKLSVEAASPHHVETRTLLRSPIVTESPSSSPERHSLDSSTCSLLDSTRRKFESEIGRDILRERKMKQELQELRSASLGNNTAAQTKNSSRSNGKCNVRELLSRFETSPTEESSLGVESFRNYPGGTLTPQPARRSDPTPRSSHTASLPPCLRARAAKAARGRLAGLTSLSVSLDGDRFLASSAGTPLVRVQTAPDINASGPDDSGRGGGGGGGGDASGDDGGGSGSEPRHPRRDCTVLKNLQNTVDLDDPERRQRIEKYKEERRMFLREKYRSESFRGERDEILQRLKHKTGKSASTGDEGGRPGKGEASDGDCEDVPERKNSEEGSRRSRFFSLSQVADESHKPGYKPNAPREGWGSGLKQPSPTPVERRLSPRKADAEDRKSPGSRSPRHSAGATSPVEPMCEKRRSHPEARSVELRLSPKADSATRPSPSAERRDGPRRRAASDSPSFFIKDMAALFENRDMDGHVTGRPASGKLSSA